MLAVIAAVLFSVMTILDVVGSAAVTSVLLDLGLICLALAVASLAPWPAAISWRRS